MTRRKSPAQLDREIAQSLSTRGQPTNRISANLPAPTMAQRLASMSIADLMFAARSLAAKTDSASDKACTAVLDELERRAPGAGFEAFVSEIYSVDK